MAGSSSTRALCLASSISSVRIPALARFASSFVSHSRALRRPLYDGRACQRHLPLRLILLTSWCLDFGIVLLSAGPGVISCLIHFEEANPGCASSLVITKSAAAVVFFLSPRA